MGLISTMLESVATIQRPIIGRDSRQGVTQPQFKILATSLPCSAQEASGSVRELYAQRNAVVTTTIFFVQDPLTEPNDRVIVTNMRTGNITTLLIQSEATSDTRGRLWSVDCQLVRAPT
jgi:hypothetical protein